MSVYRTIGPLLIHQSHQNQIGECNVKNCKFLVAILDVVNLKYLIIVH